MCNQYQGWTNYETWAVKLWIDNDESTLDYWRSEARHTYAKPNYSAMSQLADSLKLEHEEHTPETTGVYADLLNSALSSVNWYEIAESLLRDIAEDESDDDESEDAPDMRCDQCEAVMVNGVYCHETGCPNTHKVKVDGEWIDNEDESEDDY